MRAIMVWPDKTPDDHAEAEPMDYFWVECTVEEAEDKIIPLLSAEILLRYQRISVEPNRPPPEMSYMIGKRFFLISRDGTDIEPFSWFFPFAGQWNAYCPFRCMRKRKICDVSELQDIDVEIIDYKKWKKEDAI